MAAWDFNVSFHADFQREFDRGVLVANEVFGKDFSLELTAPTALDSTLVHQYIAFHFDDGWDCGQIGRKVDSSKHTESFKQIYVTSRTCGIHPVEAQCFIDCSSTSTVSARGDLTTGILGGAVLGSVTAA